MPLHKGLLALVATLLATACSPALYKEEAAAVGSATSGLAAALGDYERARAEAQRSIDQSERLDSLVHRENVHFNMECAGQARAALRAYTLSLSTPTGPSGQESPDEAFRRFRDVELCDLRLLDEPSNSDEPQAPGEAADGNQDAERVRVSASDADTDAGQAEAATLAGIRAGLAAYGAGIVGITSGESLKEVQAALEEARQGLTNMLSFAGAEAEIGPATQLITALWGLAIEETQRRALIDAVEQFDQAWPLISPALTRAARYEHARVIRDQASAAESAARSAENILNAQGEPGGIADRHSMFLLLDSRAAEANERLAASLRVDPAAAIAALTTAHGELSEAVHDDGRDLQGLVRAISILRTHVADLEAAIEKGDG